MDAGRLAHFRQRLDSRASELREALDRVPDLSDARLDAKPDALLCVSCADRGR